MEQHFAYCTSVIKFLAEPGYGRPCTIANAGIFHSYEVSGARVKVRDIHTHHNGQSHDVHQNWALHIWGLNAHIDELFVQNLSVSSYTLNLQNDACIQILYVHCCIKDKLIYV